MTASSGLDESEVKRLVKEAEEHAQADSDRREIVDLCNTADGLIYSTEKTLQEFADHVDAEERRALQDAIAATREAMESDEKAALHAAVDELSSLTYKMTENLYAELEGRDSE